MSEVETVTQLAETKEVKETVKDEVSKEEISKEDVEKAFQLIAQGKRNILCQEIVDAVNQFQEATKILAGKYGETAKECGDAYLCYGRSLLEMSRMETGVLGNALEGIEDEDDDSEDKSEASEDKVEDGEKMTEEEREKISIQVYDAMEEREEEKKLREEKEKAKKIAAGEEIETEEESEKESEKAEEETEKKDEENEKKEETGKKDEADDKENDKADAKEGETEKIEVEKKEENEQKEESEKKDGEQEESEKKEVEEKGEDMETDEVKKDDETATEAESEELNTEEEKEPEDAEESKEGEEKKDEEEDVSNLQVAWEVLELAKKIFKQEDSKESKLKLCETHLKLGEVALETEQYESAVGDFNDCLTLQKSILDEDDRLLAETYYQLGLAYNFSFQYEESISNFKSAQSVMEARIKSLEKVIEEGEKVGKGKDIADFEDPVYKAHKEVKELREILPDVATKIEDVLEEQKTADIAKAELKATVGFEKAPEGDKAEASASGAGEGSTAKPANVLVARKKRKPEDAEETKEETKKAKLENGSGDAPEAANGESTKKTEAAMETEEVKTKTVEEVKAAAEGAEASS